MDKSKLIAIVALVAGIALIGYFKQEPSPTTGAATESGHSPGDGHGHGNEKPAANSAPASKNADLSGGITTLQKKDVRVGKGTAAKAGDSVTVNYRGTLLDGKMFDESYGKAPFDFQLGAGQVIKGWDEGVAGMKVGGKRQLTIPPDLGYGERGAGADIPPGATLKFDVELLKVNGKG